MLSQPKKVAMVHHSRLRGMASVLAKICIQFNYRSARFSLSTRLDYAPMSLDCKAAYAFAKLRKADPCSLSGLR